MRSRPNLLRSASRLGAILPAVALAAIVVELAVKAWPAVVVNGFGFLTHTPWIPGDFYAPVTHTHGVAHPAGAAYGALPLIVGTVAASAIAVLLAVPVSIGAALVVVEKLPRRLAAVVGLALELLAGIPSVVFGLWGAITFGPFLAHHLSPFIAAHAPNVWGLRFLRGSTGSGEGLLTSGVVLAIMIVPIVASTARDLFAQVPRLPKEGAEALGMTTWEVARKVSLPWVRSGLIGACVLGLARALGETIAVAMVSGSVLGANPHNLYSTMTTIAATIVSQLDSALTDSTGFALNTLAEASLLLVAITLVANLGARALVKRTSGLAVPVGRGI
ncbi:MAG: phosphate ABC transporter permease subunit PstC [Acidimicrobiales bacterium]